MLWGDPLRGNLSRMGRDYGNRWGSKSDGMKKEICNIRCGIRKKIHELAKEEKKTAWKSGHSPENLSIIHGKMSTGYVYFAVKIQHICSIVILRGMRLITERFLFTSWKVAKCQWHDWVWGNQTVWIHFLIQNVHKPQFLCSSMLQISCFQRTCITLPPDLYIYHAVF